MHTIKKILRPLKPILKPIQDKYLNNLLKRHEASLNKEGIKKALTAVEGILSCTDAEFNDYDFILKKVKEFGLGNHDWPEWGEYLAWRNKSYFGLMQYPPEFAEFTMHIAKLNLNNFIEIGIFYGTSSYFMAAMLQRANPKIQYHMVDIADNLIDINRFKKILNLEIHIPATSQTFEKQEFDFVFIDGEHTYNGALTDFINLGQYCKKGVAFHDIHAHEFDLADGGTVRMWNEFKEQHSDTFDIFEFAKSPTPWMGIGLGVKK